MTTRGARKKDVEKKDDVKCKICDKTAVEIECEICLRWFHSSCVNLSQLKFTSIVNHDMHWYCDNCEIGAVTLHEKVLELIAENTKLQNKVKSLATEVKKEQNNNKTVIAECEQKVVEKFQEGRNDLKEELKTEIKDDIKPVLKTEIKHEITTDPINLDDADEENQNAWNVETRQRRAPTPNLRGIIQEEMLERKNIDLIKKNLIMAGIQESENAEEDMEKAKTIIKENLDIDAEIEKVERCGRTKSEDLEKPRPLKLFMITQDNRKKILQNATKLRNSGDEYVKTKVFISPDLTKKQQIDSKNLRALLKQKRLANQHIVYKIQRGVIIEVN